MKERQRVAGTRRMNRIFFVILIICLFSIFAFGQTKNYDIPVKIISKPKASYPKQKNGSLCVRGTITLRVQFLETGEIGKISVISGFSDGFEEFNECAVEAAKKINFKPATKDGKSVTVTKQVQYSFSLY